jgi:tetratricopeptide (TPR) repeat protein
MTVEPVSRSTIDAARDALVEAYFRTGDYEHATRLADRALRGARTLGGRLGEAAALAQKGMVLHYRAIELPADERVAIDPGPEQELFEQALALRRESDNAHGIAESLFQLGLVHQVLRRDGETAAPLFREALSLVESLPDADPLLRSEIHRHVGFDLLLREERHDEALAHLEESLEIRRGLEERAWTVSGLVALAMGERIAGRRDDAIAHAREALDLARSDGLRGRHVEAAERELAAAE